MLFFFGFSYIGFNTESGFGWQKQLCQLGCREDTQVLDEVVVAGYGVTKKKRFDRAAEQLKMWMRMLLVHQLLMLDRPLLDVAGVQVVSATGRPSFFYRSNCGINSIYSFSGTTSCGGWYPNARL